MIGSAIRELAAARKAPLLCAAFDEGSVQIWDLRSLQKTGEFAARFAFGARNLAMHPDGEFVITGISEKSGSMAGYKLPGGAPLWRRDRLSYPARARLGASGDELFCSLNNRRVERVDARTGVTSEVMEDTIHYFEGPNRNALTIPLSAANYLLNTECEIPIPKLTFAVLDVSFGSESLCITESGGPVRCVSYSTGAEHWRYTPPDGSHVLRLYYNRLDGFFYGVLWHYEKGHFRYLIRLEAQLGQAIQVRGLKSWEEAFSEATNQLVTSAGEVIDLSSGEVVGELPFPSKEYPDRYTVT